MLAIAGLLPSRDHPAATTWLSPGQGQRCHRNATELAGSHVRRAEANLHCPMAGPAPAQDVFRRHVTSVNVPGRLSSLGRMNTLAPWAGHLARKLLQEPLPRRWAHVQGVAARARSLAPVLGADADLLEAAAWLHDIGYAPGLAATGFHPLDGARYLRDAQHAGALLCRLVAHHSCAIIEAGERGLADILAREFEPAPYALSSVLTFCDMTTSPDGEPVPVERRLAEIRNRYGQGTW